MKYDKIILITQQSILKKNIIPKSLLNHNNLLVYVCKENESCKSFSEVKKITGFLTKHHCNRGSLLLSIGGGTVTDFTGFVASVYMRGISHIVIPTTLLGMVDASIGGKTAINFQGIRNIIGTFKNPEAIFIHSPFLNSLSMDNCINGYAEILKYALIMDKKLFQTINDNAEKMILSMNMNFILPIIKKCIKHKIDIVNKDQYDKDIRQILNFGHTVGHALESYLEFNISHGAAILYGMKVASYISFKEKYLLKNDYDKIIKIINIFQNAKLKLLDKNKLLSFIMLDKKNAHTKLNYIILKNIGEADIINNMSLTIIKKALTVL